MVNGTRSRVRGWSWSFLFLGGLPCAAQDSTQVRFSAYAEVYFSFDLTRPADGERPSFLFNHKRHNEVNANLVVVQAKVSRTRVRGALGLMAGTYPQYNLVAEPAALRNIYEATVGLRLSSSRDLWVEAGVFPSHIGLESAIGLDCSTLTRSLVAENSPYYEAGARLLYTPRSGVLLSALVLNGWQRIQRPVGQQFPAFGTQVQLTDTSGGVLNWSTYFGSEQADSVGQWRLYNNLYAGVDGEYAGAYFGVDVGAQQNTVDRSKADGWIALLAIAKGRFAKRWWAIGRIEYFLDDQRVVTDGISMLGASAGLDLRLDERTSWRMEGRFLLDAEERFVLHDGTPQQWNAAITTAFCMRF